MHVLQSTISKHNEFLYAHFSFTTASLKKYSFYLVYFADKETWVMIKMWFCIYIKKKTSSSAGAEEFSWYCWSWRKVVNLLVLWSGECSPYHSFYLVRRYLCSLCCVAYMSHGLILLLAGKKCRFFVSILRGGSSSVSFWTRSASFFTSWIHTSLHFVREGHVFKSYGQWFLNERIRNKNLCAFLNLDSWTKRSLLAHLNLWEFVSLFLTYYLEKLKARWDQSD